MSELKIREIEIIPKDTIIDIKISGDFIERIFLSLTELFPYKSKEHIFEIVNHVKENTNQNDPYVFNFTTLVTLVNHIEDQAREQGKVKLVKINLETGEAIEEETPPPPPSPEQSQSQD